MLIVLRVTKEREGKQRNRHTNRYERNEKKKKKRCEFDKQKE